MEREQRYRQQTAELQGIIARYRGPLLESSIDLEQRLYHLATMTGEWYQIPNEPCYEEITYTMFTLAQVGEGGGGGGGGGVGQASAGG